jgi:protein required for attachment to host cells
MAAPTWVVLADEGRARILARQDARSELEDVEELTDTAAHARQGALRRDAVGRRAGSGATADRGGAGSQPIGHATTSAGEDPLDHEAERFARRLAEHLEQAQRTQRFGELHIAAAPRFLGRLRRQLPSAVKQSVVEELDKDLLQLDRRTLTQRLFPRPGSA